jgi:tryptophan-rich sensory protein
MVLRVSNPIWCPWKDIRRLPSKYVAHPLLFSQVSLTRHPVPNPVLGGVTTFLFASVAVSGVRVLSYNKFTRRDRFVMAAAFSFGVGDLLVPTIFTHLFDGVNNPNSGLAGLFNSITIVLSTPCKLLFFCQVKITLNLYLSVQS